MRSTRPVSSRTQTEPKPTASRMGYPPTGSRATMRPVRGSTRSIALRSRSAIQSEPKPSVRPIGAISPATAPVRLFERGSIRVTVAEHPAPDTQTARALAATNPQGFSERRIVAVIAFVVGSILTTDPLMLAQTAPAPAATAPRSDPARAGPSRIVATISFVAGSMRERVGPPAFTTQTAPGVTATAVGYFPTGMVAVTLLLTGSTRETVLSGARGTQTAPFPTAGSPQTYGGQAFAGLTSMLATTVFSAGRSGSSWTRCRSLPRPLPRRARARRIPPGSRSSRRPCPPRGSTLFGADALVDAARRTAAAQASTPMLATWLESAWSSLLLDRCAADVTAPIEAPSRPSDLGDPPDFQGFQGEP